MLFFNFFLKLIVVEYFQGVQVYWNSMRKVNKWCTASKLENIQQQEDSER